MIIDKSTEFCRDFEFLGNTSREDILNKTIEFLREELQETEIAVRNNDREEILDGFGDIAFIAINGIYKELVSSGESHLEAKSKSETVLLRICEANLRKKQPNGEVKHSNGKVQKPTGWSPPTYGDII